MGREPIRIEASGERAVGAGGDVYAAATGDHGSATYIHSQVNNFGSGVAAVPVDEAVRDPRAVFDSVLGGGFTGRRWVIDRIDEFIDSRRSGYLWIEADAGMGKSALAAHLVRERGWFGHFVRYTRGETVRVALQNLAGQLIRNYELWDLAPEGQLPERRFTPEGFVAVLDRAAEAQHARDENGRIVLVVDGADEADHQPGSLPWGLPRFLPPGVFVIGTYRTGSPPGNSDPSSGLVRIDAHDERNRNDLIAYLGVRARDGAMEAWLAEVGFTVEEFISQVAARSGGVWIYVRYVLEAMRLGRPTFGGLDDLPDGLWSYYAAHLRDWRGDEHWRDGLLPVLATLAAAREPLPAETLAALAGAPEDLTREWCQSRLRPFLSTTPSTPRRFEIHHASLREILTGATPALAADRPDEQLSWAEVMGPATSAAHARIGEWYLKRFGGLDGDLEILADDPALAETDDGYALRHLAGHLAQAGRWADLHRMLRAERSVGQRRQVNVWFAAHDRADTLDAYLDDITRARDECRERTDRALAERRPATALAEEIHYTLVASSLRSLTDKVPAALLHHLVAQHIWRLPRALAFARRLTSNQSRAHALSSLVPLMPAEGQREVIEAALRAVSGVASDHFRGRELVRTVASVPAGHWPAVAAEVRGIAAGLENPQARAGTFTDLVKHVPPADRVGMVRSAQLAAERISHPVARAQALAGAIEGLPQHLRADAVERAWRAAVSIPDDRYGSRARAMAELLEHLPAESRSLPSESVLSAAHRLSPSSRVRALRLVADHLPAERRREVLARALNDATAIVNKNARVRELADLAPSLPHGQREEVRDIVLREAAGAVTDPDTLLDRTRLLQHLPAEHLPAVLEQLVEELDKPGSGYTRAQMLPELLDLLSPERRRAATERLLADAGAIDQWHHDAGSVSDLIEHTAPSHQLDLAGRVVAIMAAADSGYLQVRTLKRLMDTVAPEHRRTVAEMCLDAAESISSPCSRVETVAAAAHHVPEQRREALLDQALDTIDALTDVPLRARALSQLLSCRALVSDGPREGRTRELLEGTLADVLALPDGYDRAGSLAPLLASVPEERRNALADRALEAISDPRTPALLLIDPSLFDRMVLLGIEDPGLLETAPEAGVPRRRATMRRRARFRAGLVPYLSAERRRTVLRRAWCEADGIPWPEDRAKLLDKLRTEMDRESVVAPRLFATGPVYELEHPERSLQTALSAPPEWRAEKLLKVIDRLPAERRTAVSEQAWEASAAMTDVLKRAEVVVKLIPHLPGRLLAPVLAFVTVQHHPFGVPGLVGRAGETIATDSPTSYVAFLRAATQRLSRSDHLFALRNAAPVLGRLGGPDAIRRISDSILVVGRWWP
ncbi:ATP-binding protein [Streptomyces tanashiensis]|uniref:ATP-binding protein n=1 Tax=Streptomyces tanashiensis TaxID=67367 RepID=UPI003415F870